MSREGQVYNFPSNLSIIEEVELVSILVDAMLCEVTNFKDSILRVGANVRSIPSFTVYVILLPSSNSPFQVGVYDMISRENAFPDGTGAIWAFELFLLILVPYLDLKTLLYKKDSLS